MGCVRNDASRFPFDYNRIGPIEHELEGMVSVCHVQQDNWPDLWEKLVSSGFSSRRFEGRIYYVRDRLISSQTLHVNTNSIVMLNASSEPGNVVPVVIYDHNTEKMYFFVADMGDY